MDTRNDYRQTLNALAGALRGGAAASESNASRSRAHGGHPGVVENRRAMGGFLAGFTILTGGVQKMELIHSWRGSSEGVTVKSPEELEGRRAFVRVHSGVATFATDFVDTIPREVQEEGTSFVNA